MLPGLDPGLINASGYSWTGDYVTVTGGLQQGAGHRVQPGLRDDEGGENVFQHVGAPPADSLFPGTKVTPPVLQKEPLMDC